MNCGVVLGFYCWGWEFLTALLLFSSSILFNFFLSSSIIIKLVKWGRSLRPPRHVGSQLLHRSWSKPTCSSKIPSPTTSYRGTPTGPPSWCGSRRSSPEISSPPSSSTATSLASSANLTHMYVQLLLVINTPNIHQLSILFLYSIFHFFFFTSFLASVWVRDSVRFGWTIKPNWIPPTPLI